jgi:hypothetical protein
MRTICVILTQAGYRTGPYTSLHLCTLRAHPPKWCASTREFAQAAEEVTTHIPAPIKRTTALRLRF